MHGAQTARQARAGARSGAPQISPYKRLAWLRLTKPATGSRGVQICGTPSSRARTTGRGAPIVRSPCGVCCSCNFQVPEPCRAQSGRACSRCFIATMGCRRKASLGSHRFTGARCRGFRPFAQNRLVRLLEPVPGHPRETIVVPPFAPSNFGGAVWTPQQIIGWQEVVDYPCGEELTEGPPFSFTDDEIDHLLWLKTTSIGASSRWG